MANINIGDLQIKVEVKGDVKVTEGESCSRQNI